MLSTLRAQNLAKSYKERHVVRDVSLHVKSGEIVGLLGPNGAGKTTCFYMMVGLQRADAGEVLLNEQPITRLAMHQRARLGVGYLPQEASVFRKLTVADNILAILQLREDLNKTTRQDTLESLLHEFRIEPIRETLGIRLSGGERRRVEIARAVAANPRFMLLDEPFAGVDPISVVDIKTIIRHLASRGIGILITDHNVRETLTLCERATIMGNGHVIADGPPEMILNDQRVRDVYLGDQFSM